MTLNQLRYFRVLAKAEHYTKAANALAISQLIRYNQRRAIPERGRQPRADGGSDE